MENIKLANHGETPIDYRSLLMRYMYHVGVCEGTVFVSSLIWANYISDLEKEELKKLEKESHDFTEETH